MSEYVNCGTCQTDCVRADGSFGYTFCDRYTRREITNDAVPVSELIELRDWMSDNDLIFMQGLRKLNKLIAKYAKDGAE